MVRLPGFIRLMVTGRDRAKYLHNFCTNNVKALAAGQWCEAFFTDVKARILAHGWVLAGPDRHEIWMLPGDEAAIRTHLQRYVITEDVTITTATDSSTIFALLGSRATIGLLASGVTESTLTPGMWADRDLTCDAEPIGATVLTTVWADVPLSLCCVKTESADIVARFFSEHGLVPAELPEFDRVRIRERFPVIGIDMTSEHLAPEAQRETTAISYVKGCYLGQEPIARLDAMGHVNRALRSFQIEAAAAQCRNAEIRHPGGAMIGTLTSVCPDIAATAAVGMAVVRIHGIDLSAGVVMQTATAQHIDAQLL